MSSALLFSNNFVFHFFLFKIFFKSRRVEQNPLFWTYFVTQSLGQRPHILHLHSTGLAEFMYYSFALREQILYQQSTPGFYR